MAYGTYTETVDNGDNTSTKTTYGCEQRDLSYTIIGENIKEDFKFINGASLNEISGILDAVVSEFNTVASITDAFYFENGSSVKDLSVALAEVKQDVSNLKSSLDTLHSNYMTAIDNVNAELETNFGHFSFYSAREEASRTVSNS